jgi:hypothetical protein
VSFEREGQLRVRVVLRYSKTDQVGRATVITICQYGDTMLCPVQALVDFKGIRPPTVGPLFMHFGGDPLSSYQFGYILKEAVKAIGLSPQSFSSHSFRIGAATSASICGCTDDQIKSMGRWKSSAFKLYIRPDHLISFV